MPPISDGVVLSREAPIGWVAFRKADAAGFFAV